MLENATIAGANLELTGWAPTGATLEFFLSDGLAGGFGSGQTFVGSQVEGSGSDLDATTGSYSGAVNCFNQGSGSSVRRFKFSFTKPAGVSVGSLLTATATDAANNTSEFSGNVTVHDNLPDFTVVKSGETLSDPVNAGANPKAIPGSVVLYTVTITNSDAAISDVNSVVFTDVLGPSTELYVRDLGGAGSGPISFMDGGTTSGLTFTFTSLASTTDDVAFSNTNGATWTYVPTPDAAGFDANVTHVKITPKGIFARAACGSTPSCTLRFRVRVK